MMSEYQLAVRIVNDITLSRKLLNYLIPGEDNKKIEKPIGVFYKRTRNGRKKCIDK